MLQKAKTDACLESKLYTQKTKQNEKKPEPVQTGLKSVKGATQSGAWGGGGKLGRLLPLRSFVNYNFYNANKLLRVSNIWMFVYVSLLILL